ncbi:MAG TPA: helix-turn-helix domain-containing protein [Luteimonas sp.]|nr:helix-turn-helix domain-containing protein [Luteimonas sp.]
MKPRPIRADATRNRAQILKAAAGAFEEEGLNVSMDSIAKRAGVGPGTLYRHFPARDALLAALLLERHYTGLLETRTTLTAQEPDAGHALDAWIGALGRWMNAYDGLPEPLRLAWMQPDSALGPACQTLIEATDEFLAAAQRAGRARTSLNGRDLFLGALAVAWAGGASKAGSDTQAALHEVLRSGWAIS